MSDGLIWYMKLSPQLVRLIRTNSLNGLTQHATTQHATTQHASNQYGPNIVIKQADGTSFTPSTT